MWVFDIHEQKLASLKGTLKKTLKNNSISWKEE